MYDLSQNDIKLYKDDIIKISRISKELRSKNNGRHTTWEKPAEWHMKYSNINGVPELALTITLSPTGCEWAQNGGCTMCGEFEGSYKEKSLAKDPRFHISQFSMALGDIKIWEKANLERREIAWIRINQEGNFLNTNEMNPTAQVAILSLASRIRGVKKITIESRPQYITEEAINHIKPIFENNNVKLEIGMGLEAQNEIIRNVCINKQESNDDFIKAVSLMKKNNISPLAYIIIKPPFLNESDAIDEAVATAHFASQIGFERISFEPMSIHPFTVVDLLRQTGNYKSPWLWSVVEVVKRCKDISYMTGIGGIGYYPIPSSFAHNYCSNNNCNQSFLKAIMDYNRTRDTAVFDTLDCNCKSKWISDCQETSISLKETISKQLSQIEDLLPVYSPSYVDNSEMVRNIRIIAGASQT